MIQSSPSPSFPFPLSPSSLALLISALDPRFFPGQPRADSSVIYSPGDPFLPLPRVRRNSFHRPTASSVTLYCFPYPRNNSIGTHRGRERSKGVTRHSTIKRSWTSSSSYFKNLYAVVDLKSRGPALSRVQSDELEVLDTLWINLTTLGNVRSRFYDSKVMEFKVWIYESLSLVLLFQLCTRIRNLIILQLQTES